ncbi:hypothetical protein GDO81_002547 [Engystomops pustulosus]|uniref:Uncharacterized protein n=1 Tax=Engystomops pustulosus TaxID=76066 RepID=A0AAV7DMU3_ENGPU|nr:hypothetical protein GDO81_002547 [Engystomops pustulosus]
MELSYDVRAEWVLSSKTFMKYIEHQLLSAFHYALSFRFSLLETLCVFESADFGHVWRLWCLAIGEVLPTCENSRGLFCGSYHKFFEWNDSIFIKVSDVEC